MGHVFSYTHTDTIARYQRMRGQGGVLSHGLGRQRPAHPNVASRTTTACVATPPSPTEGFESPFRGDPPKNHHAIPISRPNFLELCDELVEIDEQIFEALLKRLGLSVDWTTSTPPSTNAQRSTPAQRAFLRNVARNEAYSQEAPTLWDIDFRTGSGPGRMENRGRSGAYPQDPCEFARTDGNGSIEIDTTRPELLAACVALVAHPDASATSRCSAPR